VQRRHFKQTDVLEERLTEVAKRLREEARGTPPGVERERLIRRARQAENAARVSEWLIRPATAEVERHCARYDGAHLHRRQGRWILQQF
jgi:hypothetical protein